MRLILALAAAAGLAACTSTQTAQSDNSYAARYAQLEAECRARGGILLPATGPMTSNPAADYPCRVQDSGRLPNN